MLLENCIVNTKKCPLCHSVFYISYACSGQTNEKVFYQDAHKLKYFQVSNETVFEIKLLEQLHSSILIQSSSFRSYAASYNYTRGYSLNGRNQLNYKRLIEIYYCWQLCRYFSDFKKCQLKGKNYSFLKNFKLRPNTSQLLFILKVVVEEQDLSPVDQVLAEIKRVICQFYQKMVTTLSSE